MTQHAYHGTSPEVNTRVLKPAGSLGKSRHNKQLLTYLSRQWHSLWIAFSFDIIVEIIIA